jgi:hypothetical protein
LYLGVKASIDRLTQEEEGLDMEAKAAHENLMRYSSEQQAIIGEMSDAPKKKKAGANETVPEAAANATVAVETENEAASNATEAEEIEPPEAEAEETEPPEAAANATESGAVAAEIKALEERVDSLEKEVHRPKKKGKKGKKGKKD